MKNINGNTILDVIIGIAGLILMKLLGAVFGTIVIIAAGGFLCYRTKKVYTYPLITVAFNFICSIVEIIKLRKTFNTLESLSDIIELRWLAEMISDMSMSAITIVMGIVFIVGSGLVFTLMIICNTVVKHKAGF